MGAASSILLCGGNSTAIAQPAPTVTAPQSLYCHHCRLLPCPPRGSRTLSRNNIFGCPDLLLVNPGG